MKTAIEWLEKELIKRFKRNQLHYTDSEWCFDMIKKLSEQAKEMEKEQMRSASCPFIGGWEEGEFEDWYNETFNK